jgi:site-specific recombinase XerD
MIEGGVDVKIVGKILGHSSVRITYDIYIHVLDKHKKESVESIDFT